MKLILTILLRVQNLFAIIKLFLMQYFQENQHTFENLGVRLGELVIKGLTSRFIICIRGFNDI